MTTTYNPAAGTGQLLCNPPFAITPVLSLTTTLNRIKACNPCDDGWQAGLQAAGKTEPDDEPISYEQIMDAVGLDDALWCCCAEPQYASQWRRYAVWCARQVQHLMTDQRSIAALDVAERHANGETTDLELAATGAAARAATWAATGAAARAAARAAACAASMDPAWAAWAAACAASMDPAWAARDATGAAAWDAAREAQSAAFRQLVKTGTLPAVEQRPEVAT